MAVNGMVGFYVNLLLLYAIIISLVSIYDHFGQ
jgi:hypothetical protein